LGQIMKKTCLMILIVSLISCSTVDRSETMKVNGLICLKDTKKPYSGTVVEYYESTYQKSEIRYRRGVLHGVSTTWHETGLKKEEGNWNHGIKDGIWKSWALNGALILTVRYRDGVPDH